MIHYLFTINDFHVCDFYEIVSLTSLQYMFDCLIIVDIIDIEIFIESFNCFFKNNDDRR